MEKNYEDHQINLEKNHQGRDPSRDDEQSTCGENQECANNK
jgi:hypothetical protein